MTSNSHNASSKKMSLEEFLGNDSLGDSVWDEDEINLDAISNTTNIDLFRPKNATTSTSTSTGTDNYSGTTTTTTSNNNNTQRPYDRDINNNRRPGQSQQYGQSPRLGRPYQDPAFALGGVIPSQRYNNRSQDPRLGGHVDMNRRGPSETNFSDFMPSPPYIIKFSNLPPKFSDFDIEDLFRAKYTKFVKFKLFWEINRNPSIDEVKNGTVFEQNFKRESKVAFVEVYTARDMSKILTYWRAPLKDIYKIITEPANFDDFKEYMTKVKLLTDPNDDAGRPYVPPKPKTNPFGAALPVDTQSKILDIEEKMERLHIEDTTTLRRLSQGEIFENGNKLTASSAADGNATTTGATQSAPVTTTSATTSPKLERASLAQENKPKISILKKPQLSYSEVLQRGVEESKKRSATTSPNLQAAVLTADTRESISTVLTGPSGQRSTNNDYQSNDGLSVGLNDANAADLDTMSIGTSDVSRGFASDNSELTSIDGDSDSRGRSVSPSSRLKPFTFKNQERETSPVGGSLSPIRKPMDSLNRQLYRVESNSTDKEAMSTQRQKDGFSQGQGRGPGGYGRGGYSRGSSRGGYGASRGGRGGSTGRYQNYNRPRYSGGSSGFSNSRDSVGSASGGNFSRRGSYDNSSGYRQNRANSGQGYEDRNRSDDRNNRSDDSGQSYSLFKPASGFLKDEREKDDQRGSGNKYGGRGQNNYGYSGRGGRGYSGRGGGSSRGRGGYSGYH